MSSKTNFFDWYLNGRNWPVTNGETWIWKSRWFETKPSVRLRTSRFCCKNRNKKLLNRILHYNCRVFDWHVDERNQTGSYAEYQVWRFRQVSIKISFRKIGTIRILMQGTQMTTIYSTDLSQLDRNPLGSWCNKRKLKSWRKLNLIIEIFQNAQHLLEILHNQVSVARMKIDIFST